MDVIYIGDLFREALWIVLTLVVAIIFPSLLVGLVVATFQAATQINEQTLSFLPRVIMTIMVISTFGPWMVAKLVDFFQKIFIDLPFIIG